MKMDILQQFINAADAVLAENLGGATRIEDVSMEPETYRRKGIAAAVLLSGEVQGRVIFDMEPATAAKVAGTMGNALLPAAESEEFVRETICELASQVIGNAITTLNDQGLRCKVFPPQVHNSDEGLHSSADTESLVVCFATPSGPVYLNIAMHY
jgi:CheY-specific phosphatase CheX